MDIIDLNQPDDYEPEACLELSAEELKKVAEQTLGLMPVTNQVRSSWVF